MHSAHEAALCTDFVAKGAYGAVYKTTLADGVTVAVKLFKPGSVAGEREMQVVRDCDALEVFRATPRKQPQ